MFENNILGLDEWQKINFQCQHNSSGAVEAGGSSRESWWCCVAMATKEESDAGALFHPIEISWFVLDRSWNNITVIENVIFDAEDNY